MTVGSIFEGFRLGAPNLVGSIRNLVAIILAYSAFIQPFLVCFRTCCNAGSIWR